MDTRRLPVTFALAALSVSVALAFGRVFGPSSALVPLVGAAVLPHAVGFLVRTRPTWPHVEPAISAGVLAVAALVLTGGGSPGTVWDRIAGGWRLVEGHAVPLPGTGGTVLLAAIVVAGAALAADDLAFRRNASIGALAPGAMVLIWITALGERSDQWLVVAGFGLTAVLFLALQHQRLLERRRTRLTPRRFVDAPALVGVALVAGIGALVVGVATAPALPGGDRPLFEAEGVGPRGSGDQSYRTSIPPLLDVGDQLRRGEEQEVFTVSASRPEYWRITALDQYRSVSGGQWTLTAKGDAVGEGLDESVPEDALIQEYRISALGERWMPAAYRPVRVSVDDVLVVRASNTLVSKTDSVTGLRYRVSSALPATDVTPADQQRAARPAPAELAEYTRLPDDFPENIRAQADVVAAGLTNPFDQARALRDFFRSDPFVYDVTVQLGDDISAIETFLALKRGFCVQFASAYATMARSLGIPARIAVGFTPGTRGEDGVYRVTNYDAHAWPEIWLTGMGWTHLFDPTPASTEPGGSELPGESAATDTPVPQSTTDTTTPETTPGSVPTATTPAPAPGAGGGVTVDPDAADESDSGSPWVPLIALGIVLLIAVPILVLLIVPARRRARRRNTAEPAVAIEGAWSEAIEELGIRRITWPESATPLELARRVPVTAGAATARPMRALAETYGRVRYGDEQPPSGDAQDAWDHVDSLRRALDDASSPFERVRAKLSPRRLVGAARTGPDQPEPAGWSLRRPSTKD